MSTLRAIDYGIRLLISYLFRIIIVFYSLSIIFRKPNYFDEEVYLFGIIVYLVIFVSLHKKEGIYAYLRLINDYLFFVLILYKKDVNDFHFFTLLILPIVNSLNHSSQNKKNKVFSLPLYFVTIAAVYILRNFKFQWRDLAALTAFATINLLLYVRYYITDFANNLSDSIENFYEENLRIGQSHELLKKLKDKLNKKSIARNLLNPTHIVCFRMVKGHLIVVSATEFVMDYSIIDPKFYDGLLENKILIDQAIKINGDTFEKTVLIYIRLKNGGEYIYALIQDGLQIRMLTTFYAEHILSPILIKVTRLIEIEIELKNDRKNYLNKLKNKMYFIDNTVKGIHYLNNRLSPIANFFSLMEEKTKMQHDDPKLGPLNSIIEKELETAKVNMQPIIEKTHQILKKSSNPYIITEKGNVSLYHIISSVRTIWGIRGLNKDRLKINWPRELMAFNTSIDEDSFDYVIEEIINNMEKHHNSIYEARFIIHDEAPVIYFVNDIKQEEKNVDLKKLIDDVNRDTASELLRRKSHGMYFIKQYLQQMDIHLQLQTSDGFYILKLIFESSNG